MFLTSSKFVCGMFIDQARHQKSAMRGLYPGVWGQSPKPPEAIGGLWAEPPPPEAQGSREEPPALENFVFFGKNNLILGLL